MKKRPYFFCIPFVLVVMWFFSACTGDDHSEHVNPNEYYTCPMHPTIRSDKPGVCPVCNMTLVKASSIAQDTAANTIQIVEEQQPLANIATDTVVQEGMNEELVLLGVTTLNENKVNVISSRAPGRVEKLIKRVPGEIVKKGELLYTLYSEELVTSQKEYISAIEQSGSFLNHNREIKALLLAMKTRLILAGLTEKQVIEIEKFRRIQETVPFYSETSGIIREIAVREGEYIETGSLMYSIADLSTLWVDAQVYRNEIPQVSIQTAEIEINGKKYKGSVDLATPSLEPYAGIRVIKFRIDNKNLELKPGMMARVTISGEERQTIAISKEALLLGEMSMVWLKIGPELFKSRMVKTGMETKNKVEILEGLNEGDVYVTSGAYLVNSEYILKKGATVLHAH